MIADIGTKPNTPTVFKRFKYWITGERYLPSPNHEHYNLLEMQFYEMFFHEILKVVKDKGSFQNNNDNEKIDYFSRRGGSCDSDHTGIRISKNSNHASARQNIEHRLSQDA